MSEARALTNFAGNAVATVLIGSWTREFNADQARKVLAGENPFNEATLLDDEASTTPTPASGRESRRTGSGSPAPSGR